MSDNLMRFDFTSSNPYWELLKDSNQLHITARQKHGQLLDLCKSKGVAFKDLEAHLLKEAKKCGLYVANSYNNVTKKMSYPPLKEVAKLGWYNALHRFIVWTYKNYYDYDLTNEDRSKRVAAKKSKAVIRNTDTGATRTIEVEGASISQVTGAPIPPATTGVNSQHGSFLSGPANVAPQGITRPIDSTMSLSQVQAIILRNFAVLGKICEEHGPGAVEAFNMLMVELGQDDECIPEQEISIQLAA